MLIIWEQNVEQVKIFWLDQMNINHALHFELQQSDI